MVKFVIWLRLKEKCILCQIFYGSYLQKQTLLYSQHFLQTNWQSSTHLAMYENENTHKTIGTN